MSRKSVLGAKKRGMTHQDNQQSSSAGVGPGQDGSSGAVTAATSWAPRRSAELGLAVLETVRAADVVEEDTAAGAVAVAAAARGPVAVSWRR